MNNRCLVFCFILAFFCLSEKPAAAQNSVKAKDIDRYLQEMLTKNQVPGFAVAVVSKDSVLFSKGYGVNGNGDSITSESPFAIASLSKAFTAMAVMQLVSAGKINLDKPVISYVPAFKLADHRGSQITVRQLLNQTSGLNDVVFPELAFHDQPENLEQSIARLGKVKLADDPGAEFRYHNPNYQILAKIVESVSGQSFPEYLKKNLFQPLQMLKTRDVGAAKLFESTSANFSDGHLFFAGIPIACGEPDWIIEGAAGMVSTADDMAKWLRLQLNHGAFQGTSVLDSASLNAMHKPPGDKPYGMGWFAGNDGSILHSGILWTYSSEQMITKDGYGIVMLFNGGINAFQDYHAFIQGVADILDNKKPEVPALPGWLFPIVIVILLVVSIGFAFRRILRREQWHQKYLKRPVWKSVVFLFVRILPLAFFLAIPCLLTLISNRVLNWNRIFLMAPDLIAGIGLVALLNLIVVLTRILYLRKNKR